MPRPMEELTEVEHHVATLFASLELRYVNLGEVPEGAVLKPA
jgi:hypothetical protein